MKNKTYLLLLLPALVGMSPAQDAYTNFVRQIQLPDDGVPYDMDVAESGEALSPLEINPNGARFELHTVRADPFESFLLDTTYVNSYIPVAEVVVRSEDPYTPIKRTRADRPFAFELRIDGLLSGADDPDASKSVDVFHHVQSYGEDGDGTNIDRSMATLIGSGNLSGNGLHTMWFDVTVVPGADRSKIRGEERVSVYSLLDHDAPPSELDSAFIQIWPVADGTLTGLEEGQEIRFSSPQVTMTVNDIYPDSEVFCQVYPGAPALGTEGIVVPGSAKIYKESVPQALQLAVKDWDGVLTEDGQWTMELLTSTPFGIDRLDYVSFTVNRTIEVNSGVTTLD